MSQLKRMLLAGGFAALVLGGLAVVRLPAVPALPDAVPSIQRATHKDYTEIIPDAKVCFDLVAVPGGTFLMGSPAGEGGRSADEGPQHPVEIRPFWMGKCEVTWDEYDLYFRQGVAQEKENKDARAKDADAITRPTSAYADETRGFGRTGYPVVGMSQHAAMEYCRWLSGRTGRSYRLPTEAEWEWACRAGNWTAYSFGDGRRGLGDHAWFAANADETTHPVGKKKPNRWGLHDMHGNVAEWCLDHYQPDYYRSFPLQRLSPGPVKLPTADRFPHVVRGGSWADAAAQCRSASRRGSDASWNRRDPMRPQSIWWLWNVDFVGFRVVRAVEEQRNLEGIRSKITPESK